MSTDGRCRAPATITHKVTRQSPSNDDDRTNVHRSSRAIRELRASAVESPRNGSRFSPSRSPAAYQPLGIPEVYIDRSYLGATNELLRHRDARVRSRVWIGRRRRRRQRVPRDVGCRSARATAVRADLFSHQFLVEGALRRVATTARTGRGETRSTSTDSSAGLVDTRLPLFLARFGAVPRGRVGRRRRAIRSIPRPLRYSVARRNAADSTPHSLCRRGPRSLPFEKAEAPALGRSSAMRSPRDGEGRSFSGF